MERFNTTRHPRGGPRTRRDPARAFGRVGDGVVVRASFRCDYGFYISIGAGTFVNYACVLLDVAPIGIGDD